MCAPLLKEAAGGGGSVGCPGGGGGGGVTHLEGLETCLYYAKYYVGIRVLLWHPQSDNCMHPEERRQKDDCFCTFSETHKHHCSS